MFLRKEFQWLKVILKLPDIPLLIGEEEKQWFAYYKERGTLGSYNPYPNPRIWIGEREANPTNIHVLLHEIGHFLHDHFFGEIKHGMGLVNFCYRKHYDYCEHVAEGFAERMFDRCYLRSLGKPQWSSQDYLKNYLGHLNKERIENVRLHNVVWEKVKDYV